MATRIIEFQLSPYFFDGTDVEVAQKIEDLRGQGLSNIFIDRSANTLRATLDPGNVSALYRDYKGYQLATANGNYRYSHPISVIQRDDVRPAGTNNGYAGPVLRHNANYNHTNQLYTYHHPVRLYH